MAGCQSRLPSLQVGLTWAASVTLEARYSSVDTQLAPRGVVECQQLIQPSHVRPPRRLLVGLYSVSSTSGSFWSPCLPGFTVVLLDTTIVNVALARQGSVFEVNHATVQWVITGYS